MSRSGRETQRLQAETDSQIANAQWDENGFLRGPQPSPGAGVELQFEANRRADQRRQALWGDAHQALQQGQNLFQSYRPGGSAALASGLFGQQASLYGTQALNTEAPDLLFKYREAKQDQADRERQRADKFNRNIATFNVVNSLANPVGSFLSGPTAPAPTQAPQQAPQNPGGGGPGGAAITAPGSNVALPSGGGVAIPGSGGVQGLSPSQPLQQGGPGAYNSLVDPSGGPGGSGSILRQGRGGDSATVDGSFGGGGGGGGPAGGGGSRVRGGSGGGRNPSGGSYEPLTTFTGQEQASHAMAGSPGAKELTATQVAGDSARGEGVSIMASASRQRLTDAAGGKSGSWMDYIPGRVGKLAGLVKAIL